ncbi:DUF2490 domain-containing protein [Formosa algae]|uniref:DUF2490 domain-containing protein n=1 Tax=Formosa algae TaxID=225843 RepID=A0A9X0YJ56_9FLAO|nr:DUF2490 domain-containing protein [Formosa algae]MBP1838212.1 hypothetical protein [Formosa algae]MDQ0334347.1 hypothetical protein [Formosa algae]OEI80704.1 hypothetical protein AST99_07785 [Formosa algae]PNW29915.1 hypothetical protein BKP44_02005 [Formosa algae]
MIHKLQHATPCFHSELKSYVLQVLCVICFFFFNNKIHAQVDDESVISDNDFTSQLWFDLNPSWDVGSGQKINGEFGYRTIWPKSWQRFIVRGSFQSVLENPLLFKNTKHTETVVFGTGLFLLTSKTSHNSFEVRPFQGYKFAFNISPRFVLQQYFRAEQRFVFSGAEDNQIVGLRMRYQVKGIINLEGVFFEDDMGFYLPVSIEGFFNLIQASQFNDVIRVTPGLGYQFNSDFKLEGSLAYHYTRQDSEKLVRTNDIVFRFRIIKTFR